MERFFDNLINSQINKKDLIQISEHFPKPYECSGRNIKAELGLSNFATKSNRC